MLRLDLKKRLIEAHRALPPLLRDYPLLIAVSGGMDSSVLAAVALECKSVLPPLHWAHVNYHLRVPDSDAEEATLRNWAKRVRLPLHLKRFFPKTKPAQVQAWAREKRLLFFATIAKKLGGRVLVVLAHHQRDQAETILERLLRGSGLQGLSGMEPLETLLDIGRRRFAFPLHVFRPFLQVPFAAIERYAVLRKLVFHQDRSNVGKMYLRNRIRLELLPWLLQENPRMVEALVALGERAGQADHALTVWAETWLRRVKRTDDDSLPLLALRKLPPAVFSKIVMLWLREKTLIEQSWNAILPRVLSFATRARGRDALLLKGDYCLELSSEKILLRPGEA